MNHASAASPTGAFVSECLVGSGSGWTNFISFFFDGMPYDYGYVVGGLSATAQDALDNARSMKCMGQAQRAFLNDVNLNMELPH
jgi:hypothetical protein